MARGGVRRWQRFAVVSVSKGSKARPEDLLTSSASTCPIWAFSQTT
jgi:hypothetical protein